MIDEIKKTFKRRVKDHEWIDDATTKHVFDKVIGTHIMLEIDAGSFRKCSLYMFVVRNVSQTHLNVCRRASANRTSA